MVIVFNKKRGNLTILFNFEIVTLPVLDSKY